MELHRQHSVKLDEMEKTDFISLINNFFKFDDKIILERIFQVFNTEKVKVNILSSSKQPEKLKSRKMKDEG